ncbi:MAG: hypothetical protein KC636_28550, partial [Myxococcales bacterium]|nr:hypothetical protein [Myxococcales bacterium]
MTPAVDAIIETRALREHFGVSAVPKPPASVVAGVGFLMLDRRGALRSPTEVALPSLSAVQTAHVLAAEPSGTHWRYLGAATWTAKAGVWVCEEVDHDAWARFGVGRSVSRTPPEWGVAAARAFTAALVGKGTLPRPVISGGRTLRVLERTSSGGLRVDGGAAGFRPRSISVTDLAWVLVA